MWNDITALTGAPESPAVAAELGLPVVLMHMKGEPRTMQDDPRYADPLGEVSAYLLARTEAAMAAGVRRENIWLDPGIGFGKRLEHNLALLANLDRLAALGFPILLGVSRKRTVLHIDATATDPNDRLGGSLAMALHGAAMGVAGLRVHDVRQIVQALAVQRAIRDAPR
jgi:dihydropteroate synthase